MSTKKVILGQVAILGAFLAVPLSGVLAVDAERGMGFGSDGERGIPSVTSCVERTGKTEAECQQMMSSWGDRKPGEGRGNATSSEKRNDRGIKNDTNRPPREEEGMKNRFQVMETRLSRVMAYLQSKQVSTSELESTVAVLKEKIASAERAGVLFETARTTWKNNKTDANKTALESARTNYKTSVTSVKTHYQGTVLPLVKTRLQSVTE